VFNPKALNRRMTKAGLVAAVLFCVVLGCVVLPSHVQASQNCFLGVSSQCSAWNPLHVNASWVEQQLQLEFANNSVFGPSYNWNWNNSLSFNTFGNDTSFSYTAHDPAYNKTARLAELYCVNSDLMSVICDTLSLEDGDPFGTGGNSVTVSVSVSCVPSPSITPSPSEAASATPSPSKAASATPSPSKGSSPTPSTSPIPHYSPLPNVSVHYTANLSLSLSSGSSSGVNVSFGGFSSGSGSGSLPLQNVSVNSTVVGGNEQAIYRATIGRATAIFNYTTQSVPLKYTFDGYTFSPPKGSTKWTLDMLAPYPFSTSTFNISNVISLNGGKVSGVVTNQGQPSASMTTYVVNFVDATSGVPLDSFYAELFQTALVDGSSYSPVGLHVTVSPDNTEAILTLVLPSYTSSLYYDPTMTLAAPVASPPSPASGGGSSGALIGGIVGGVVGGVLLLILIAAAVVVVVILIAKKKGGPVIKIFSKDNI